MVELSWSHQPERKMTKPKYTPPGFFVASFNVVFVHDCHMQANSESNDKNIALLTVMFFHKAKST